MLDSYWIRLLIIVLILALAALFTLLEYAVVKVRPSELQELPQTKTVQKAEHMVANLSEYLSTAQVGVTMTSLILGWLGDTYITDLLMMVDVISADVRRVIAPIVGVLIFTFFHAVFTDLVPKNMAIDRPVQILMAIVHRFSSSTGFLPVRMAICSSCRALTKALGFNVQPEEDAYSQMRS